MFCTCAGTSPTWKSIHHLTRFPKSACHAVALVNRILDSIWCIYEYRSTNYQVSASSQNENSNFWAHVALVHLSFPIEWTTHMSLAYENINYRSSALRTPQTVAPAITSAMPIQLWVWSFLFNTSTVKHPERAQKRHRHSRRTCACRRLLFHQVRITALWVKD